MANRPFASNLGLYCYAVAALALGLLGLVSGDFATGWQRVQPGVPHREALAYLAALCELLAGGALLWRRTARVAALLLTLLYSVFTLLWVARVFVAPLVYDNWGNVFEELSLVIAGVVAYVSLAPPNTQPAASAARVSRLFGVCVVSFGLVHIVYFSGTASFVPKWIPPGQRFWAAATAVFFLLAAAAILSGILAGVASRWLTVMIFCFEILVWAPMLFTQPRSHFVWAGNAICLAIAAAAWVVSDALNNTPRRAPAQENLSQLVA